MPKLSKACYIMRVMKPIMYIIYLKSVYHSFFYSFVTYRIKFWVNSSYSVQIFRLQKRIIRIMSGLSSRDSCRN